MADIARTADRLEIRFSGSGGQGILLVAAIVADAAATMRKQVVQSQSYGPAARGGASKAEVIISDEDIDYPEVQSPGVSLCLSQAAYDKYAGGTRSGGLLLYDSGLVDPGEGAKPFEQVGLPFTQEATDRLKKVVANIVALGALVEIAHVLPADQVQEALGRRVPGRFLELNVQAFGLGRELAAQRAALPVAGA